MQIVGYHHSISPIEKVLPKLLEKVLASGQRAVVITSSEEQLKVIDTFLWTYSKSELLPHGTADDGNPTLQPIWLTCAEENPNQAQVMIVVGSLCPSNVTIFAKVLLLNQNWSNEISKWAQSQGEFTLWSERSAGGWEKLS